MEIPITANGTKAFFLDPGHYRYEVGGTLAAGASVSLMAGPSADGAGHVPVNDIDGVAIQHTSSATPAPQIVWGGGYYSVVTTNLGASSGVFVRVEPAG